MFTTIIALLFVSGATATNFSLQHQSGGEAAKVTALGLSVSKDIDMTSHKITSLATPTATTDATTKTYVDTADAKLLPLAGGTMSGAIAMGTSKITGIGEPTLTSDAASKFYVDTADNKRLLLAGGTMTGNINMGTKYLTNMSDGDNTAAPFHQRFATMDALTNALILAGSEPAFNYSVTKIGKLVTIAWQECNFTSTEGASAANMVTSGPVLLDAWTRPAYPTYSAYILTNIATTGFATVAAGTDGVLTFTGLNGGNLLTGFTKVFPGSLSFNV